MKEKQNLIIYKTDDGKASVALYARDGSVWLTQSQLAELFATSKQNISAHILNILEENELDENSVVKDFLTTAADGKNYTVRHYALPMILMEDRAGSEYETFNTRRKQHESQLADAQDLEDLRRLEETVKQKRLRHSPNGESDHGQ